MRQGKDSFAGLVYLFAAAAMTILLGLSGCSSQPAGEMSSSQTGEVTFAVEWEPPPDGVPVVSSSALARSSPRPSAIDVCVDYGIDTVTMQVLLATEVLVEQSFPCGSHSGTLAGVPAGDNLLLRLRGGSAGTVSWNGQSETFALAAGTTYDAGMITMVYTGSDDVAPTVVDVAPRDSTVNVLESSPVSVRFSEPMAINTVIDNGAIQVLEEGGGPVAGLVSYDSAERKAVFDPVNPLPSGKSFSVLVSSDIQDMAGNPIGSAFSSAFFTRFRGEWGLPVQIENTGGDTGNGNPPYIGVDFSENGDAFVVSQKNVNQTIFVYGSRYSETSNIWSPTTVLSPTTLYHSFAPKVAADDAGNAIAVWEQIDLSSNERRVLASRYSLAGSAWSAAEFIDVGQGSGTNPSISMYNMGNALVSYFSSDIFVSRYLSNTGEWQPGLDPLGCSGTYSDISTTQNGEYLIACISGGSVVAVGSVGTGTIGSATGSSKVSAAVDDNGNAVVVWDSSDNTVNTVWSSFYTTLTGFWSEPTIIHQGVEAAAPSVAISSAGEIVAVWGGGTNFSGLIQESIYASHSTVAGKTWSSPVLLWDISGKAGFVGRPELAMDPDGNAIAVWIWRDDIPLQYSVLASRYDSAAKAWSSSPTRINGPNDLGVIYDMDVSMNDNGDAVAVWFEAEDTGGQIEYFVHVNFRYK